MSHLYDSTADGGSYTTANEYLVTRAATKHNHQAAFSVLPTVSRFEPEALNSSVRFIRIHCAASAAVLYRCASACINLISFSKFAAYSKRFNSKFSRLASDADIKKDSGIVKSSITLACGLSAEPDNVYAGPRAD